jgi:acyl-[acyl-carrier-protein]-phospholipid O-acyltransferase/long-chain-fatty-acid--[acyl-carrier-protein] ligase
LKTILKIILGLVFRVEVKGKSHYQQAGDRVILLSNHVSYIDAVLVKLFIDDSINYGIDRSLVNHWWARLFIKLFDFCVVDITDPMSVKQLIDFLAQNNNVLLFPEGRVSTTNSLMKIYQSAGLVIDKSDATIVPLHIEGAQYTYFSGDDNGVRQRFFPKITLNIQPAVKLQQNEVLKGQQRRAAIADQLTSVLRHAKYVTGDYNKTLFRALLDARSLHGSGYKIIEDINNKALSYRQLIFRCILLSRTFDKKLPAEQTIGVFLPTTIAATLLIFSLSLTRRSPAMLNYGAGLKALLSCISSAQIKHIYTSRKFIKEGGFEETLAALEQVANVHFLEDTVADLTLYDKLSAKVISLFPSSYYRRYESVSNAEDTAVILFTSGSEGLPKGVALTHKNLLVNAWQVVSIIDFTHKDLMLNFLPVFHSFGFTVGTILPIIHGLRLFQYPSPLHYKIIPEKLYQTGATIIFSTNTFLRGYGLQAHPYDFHRLRYVFAGAEPLTRQTEDLWYEKFGIRILQGYGVTETSPGLAANTPLGYRRGSVGRFMPGLDYKLIDVPGINNGKRLLIKGENVMKGYILPDQPGQIIPTHSDDAGAGWHDTGDIVHIDEDGYIFIRGRAKRFAKVGSEMVSLAAVEQMVNDLWPEYRHAAVSKRDELKGEVIILFTEYPEASRTDLVSYSKEQGISELHIPKQLIQIEELPVLTSGKIDYISLQTQLDQST